MNSEAEKVTVIRRHLSQLFPGWTIEDGSRTGVDRTLQLFEGVTLKSTVQIGMDLLRDTDRPQSDLERALQEKDIAGWLLSAPIVYLNNNTLGLHDEAASMATTQKYCTQCEKLLDSRSAVEREFLDAKDFRPSTDASGHVHQTQHGTCDKCGETKMVSFYELPPAQ